MIELMTAAGLSSEPQAGQQIHTQEPNKIFRFIVGLWPLAPYFCVCWLVLFVAQNCTVCLLLPLVVRVVVVQFQPSATPSDGMNCTMIAVHALHPLFIESYAEEKEEQGGDLRIHKGPVSCEKRWTTSGSTFPSQ